MKRKFPLLMLTAGLAVILLSGCYSQYQTSSARPGDHVGHGSYGALGPRGHHGALHGNHYFHDDRWGHDHLEFPRPKSPRGQPLLGPEPDGVRF